MNFKEFNTELEEVTAWLKREYQSIRTGMASPAVLDGVKVDSYGSLMPLNQVASVSIEGAKSLFVAPYDKSITKQIEKALIDANLGVSVVGTDTGVRVSFPDLTSERRGMLAKLAKEKLEDARVSVRKVRDEYWKFIQEAEKNSEITEDEKFTQKEQMEDRVKELNKELEEVLSNKEKEISE